LSLDALNQSHDGIVYGAHQDKLNWLVLIEIFFLIVENKDVLLYQKLNRLEWQ